MAIPTTTSLNSRLIRATFIALLAYVPFHALIYVWAGTNLGSIDWFKIVPQLVIAAITPIALWQFAHDTKLRKLLVSRKVNWLILWYIVLHIGIAAWQRPETDAMIAGLMINLRIMAMFLLGQVLVFYYSDRQTARMLAQVVLATGLMTVFFGVLQVTVLPDDFLRWFGFRQDTIRPFTKLHEGSSVLRFSSTLRGPNTFGAYLAFLLSALVVMKRRAENSKVYWWAIGAGLITLLFTFSRSAWIATVISVCVYLGFTAKKSQLAKGFVIGFVGMLAATTLIVVFRDNNVIENGIFHTDETNVSVTSNDGHIASLKAGLRDVQAEPFGRGPGTAGPASVNLEKSEPRFSENYYLQIAQEVGVLGLMLFVFIFCLIMHRALMSRAHLWPMVLLITGIGLAVANGLLHVWADDTIGIIWWGLAGYFLYLPAKSQPK